MQVVSLPEWSNKPVRVCTQCAFEVDEEQRFAECAAGAVAVQGERTLVPPLADHFKGSIC